MIRHYENEGRWEVEYILRDGVPRTVVGSTFADIRTVRTFTGPDAEDEAWIFWREVCAC